MVSISLLTDDTFVHGVMANDRFVGQVPSQWTRPQASTCMTSLQLVLLVAVAVQSTIVYMLITLTTDGTPTILRDVSANPR